MSNGSENEMKHSYNVVPFPQKKGEPAEEEGFKGQFKNLKLSDLIQLSAQGRMDVVFHISQEGEDGKIYIHEGEIIHAACGKKTGIDAFFEIMSWKKGNFRSETYVPPPIQSITLPWEHLLIEAHRWMDEKSEKARQLEKKVELIPLEELPEDLMEKFAKWGESHPDVNEIGILSSGGVKNIYIRNKQMASEKNFEVLHVFPHASRFLCEAYGISACNEVIINGKQGTIIILFLKENAQFFVHIRGDISQKAILKMELESFIRDVKQQLDSSSN